MAILVKICGINSAEAADAAVRAGADLAGLVFHPKSPRYLSLDAARALAERMRGRLRLVALVADADDATIAAAVQRGAARLRSASRPRNAGARQPGARPVWPAGHQGDRRRRGRRLRRRAGLRDRRRHPAVRRQSARRRGASRRSRRAVRLAVAPWTEFLPAVAAGRRADARQCRPRHRQRRGARRRRLVGRRNRARREERRS